MKVAFLDRDGTIMEDTGYPNDPDEVRLIPHALEGLLLMKKKGYHLFVLSNQSGVARGLISQEQFHAVHNRFTSLLKEGGVELAGAAYCLHHPDENCPCRKPKTGLVPRKIKGQQIDLSRSFMVGDRLSDLLLGQNLGITPFLVLTGKGKSTLREAKKEIEKRKISSFSHLLELAQNL